MRFLREKSKAERKLTTGSGLSEAFMTHALLGSIRIVVFKGFCIRTAALFVIAGSLGLAPALAQGPPLFQAAWSSSAAQPGGEGGLYAGTVNQNCASATSNPYPTPRIPLFSPLSLLPPFGLYPNQAVGWTRGCAVGSSLAETTALVVPIINTLNAPGSLTGHSSASATASHSFGTPLTLADLRVAVTGESNSFTNESAFTEVAYYQEGLAAHQGSKLSRQFAFTAKGNFAALDSGGNQEIFASVTIEAVSDDPTKLMSSTIPITRDTTALGPIIASAPAITIGPSGTYSIYVVISVNNNGSNPVEISSGCGSFQVDHSSGGTTLTAQYKPDGKTLSETAVSCGFLGFDWQQWLDTLPCPSPFDMNVPNNVPTSNYCPASTVNFLLKGPTLTAPASFNDPVEGGYPYLGSYDSFPFYFPPDVATSPGSPLIISGVNYGPFDIDDLTLRFEDTPADPCLPGSILDASLVGCTSNAPPGSFLGFTTALVGVLPGNVPTAPLFQWTWKDTFNGTSGGIATTFNLNPVDPGSGTGGITITSINGTPVTIAPSSGMNCNGTYYGNFNSNVTVANGQTCIFISGGISGDVKLSGGTLALSDATVNGNVQITGGTFNIGPSTIIKGGLTISNLPSSSSENQVCGTTVQGNLYIQNSGAPVQIGSPPFCPGNVIGGNLQVQNNTGSTALFDNSVGGNLQDQDNTAPTQVFGNRVTGHLQCQSNSAITGGGNSTAGQQGQCATFSQSICSDGTFNLANYSQTIYNSDPADVTITVSQSPNGDPGTALEVKETWSAPNITFATFVAVINNSCSFNPSKNGGVPAPGLGFSVDSSVSGTGVILGGPHDAHPLIFQHGNFYFATVTGPTSVQGQYQTISGTGLTASDFQLINLNTGTVNPTQHPDFSPSGRPINFGSLIAFGHINPMVVGGEFDVLEDNLSFMSGN